MSTKHIVYLIIVLIFIGNASAGTRAVRAGEAGLELSSPAFNRLGFIPQEYTCDGKDVNPGLVIKNVPKNAKSLALIVDDPDAPVGTWVHWLLWNMSPDMHTIKQGSVPEPAVQGINSFKKHEYGGPCPPWGIHRYFFTLYALDTILTISPASEKPVLEKAMKDHILAQTELMGRYKRK